MLTPTGTVDLFTKIWPVFPQFKKSFTTASTAEDVALVVDGDGATAETLLSQLPPAAQSDAPVRAALEKGAALIPSAKKMGGMGTAIDVPLGHKDAAYVRSHFDAITISVPDAPRADEIVFVLAMSKGPRVHSRMGGLEVWQIKGEDGLR